MPNSKEKVWWIYSYDDPETCRHFDFEWKARITDRVQDDSGCPFLSNNAVWKGFNDLRTKRPDLADEWDFEKNGIKKDGGNARSVENHGIYRQLSAQWDRNVNV